MTKVLIVDDSALMRRLISTTLCDAGFKVETARNGREGVERLTEWQPDVVTLDINMPEMDGLTALSLMMQARPTPVVMVSSLTARGAQATFEALALGAVDFIAKPGGTISTSVEQIATALIDKVRAASKARMRDTGTAFRKAATEGGTQARDMLRNEQNYPVRRTAVRASPRSEAPAGASRLTAAPAGLVLLGVSTGGPRTLEDVLPELPANFPWPVLVAQHMPPNFTSAFANRMAKLCAMQVREVNAVMPVETGTIYIGQGGTDAVCSERLGRLVVMPKPESPAHPWHPSVDVLVESAMKMMDPARLVGVLLTGMGNDGARTMTQLRQRGGRTIAEAKESAVVFGMPQELINMGGAVEVLHSTRVAAQLCEWVA